MKGCYSVGMIGDRLGLVTYHYKGTTKTIRFSSVQKGIDYIKLQRRLEELKD